MDEQRDGALSVEAWNASEVVKKQIITSDVPVREARVEQGEAQRGVKGADLLTKAPRRRRCFSAPTRDIKTSHPCTMRPSDARRLLLMSSSCAVRYLDRSFCLSPAELP